MAAVRALKCLAFLATAAGANFLEQQLGFQREQGLVRALEFNHKLRVCNAYPNAATLDVFRGESERLTGDSSMPYKACRDLPAKMRSGDRLEFKVGEVSQGSFSVSELPDNDAVLLLVVHKHDKDSTAMAFDSHVFGNIAGAQVAIIDTYKGVKRATPMIKDETPVKNHHKSQKSEKLPYSSVVAVNQGKYSVALDDEEGHMLSKSNLVALDHENYVVLRTGDESKNGQSYPEELVVFPQSDAQALPHSGSAPASAPLVAMFALVAAACM